MMALPDQREDERHVVVYPKSTNPDHQTIQVGPYIQWLTIVLASERGIGTG